LKALSGILPLVMPGMQRPQPGPPAQLPSNVEPMPAPEPVKPNPFPQATQPVIETTPAEPQQNGAVKIQDIIKSITPMLLARIESGSKPDDALAIMENPILISDDQFDQLIDILEKPDWPMVLFGGDDAIAKHRQWFDELRELLLKSVSEQPEGPVTEV
jgi:hypothetical protein